MNVMSCESCGSVTEAECPRCAGRVTLSSDARLLAEHALKALDQAAAELRLVASIEIDSYRAKAAATCGKVIESAVQSLRLAMRSP